MSQTLTRRHFLGHTIKGGALAGAFMLGFPTSSQAQSSLPEINAWVVIQPDETVIIRIARSEMGQGTLTGLAQLVAEELECDWARVKTEYPTPGQNLARNRVWRDFHTGGSRGIRESHDYVRRGGAAARTLLVQAAAQHWKVEPSECRVTKGIISHAASGRSTSYGRVAALAAGLKAPTEVPLKDPKSWTLVGQPMARLDTADKTNGKQVFGIDFKLPGMLNAAIRHCRVPGGKVKRFDAAAVSSRPGVKKVLQVDDSSVAVVADTFWNAKSALDALPIEWDFGPNGSVQQTDIEAFINEGLNAEKAAVGTTKGDPRASLASAAKKVEAVYAFPFQNHATMEPMNATALWTPERCEVWTPTQSAEIALGNAARAAELPREKCDIHKINLGGGFGRRSMIQDWVPEVVKIAKAMPGTPVKLIWTREEDMIRGRYHPYTACKMSAGLDAQGNVTGLHMRLSGQSIVAMVLPSFMKGDLDPYIFQGVADNDGEAMIGYEFPNLLIDHAMRNPHIPPGFWRGVNLNQNAFYMECFIDEMAHAAGQDPLVFRRKLMARFPKHLAVLEAVATRVGWGKPAAAINGQKVYRGLAQTHGYGSYVAACAEVSVAASGDLTIHRIVAATDCGYAVNPQQIAAQVEGSFAFGLTAALFGECNVKDGGIKETNFDTSRILRMAEMPRVETIVMPSGGFWGGVGEPTIAVAGPAVLNAVFAATGTRVRKLPLARVTLKSA